MTPTRFELRFSDLMLADALAKSKPPDGVKITVSRPFTQASHVGFLTIKVAFDISMSVKVNVGIGSVLVASIAAWVSKKLKAKVRRRKNKHSRVNGKIIPLNKRNIILLINQDMAAQIERDAQNRDDKKQQSTKRNETV
jgi:hypothetical protein